MKSVSSRLWGRGTSGRAGGVATADAAGLPAGDRRPELPRVDARDIGKEFPDGKGGSRRALEGVSLAVAPGEFVVLLGPSGCGKTTLLRCVAGLESPTEGQISVSGRVVFSSADKVSEPPDQRGLNMVFQSYALWPHMTVLDNVAYPLRCRRVQKAERWRRAREMLELVGLGDRAQARPAQLSGGQQQRVALARAIVSDAEVVLFDEPLSNLDAKVRERLRDELISLQRRLGFTALYVTHDQAEAMAMADRIVVMDSGRIEQIGSPAEIYDQPRTRYVATFVGSANELSGTVIDVRADRVRLRLASGVVDAISPGGSEFRVGETAVLLVRPEYCELAPDPAKGDRTGVVIAQTYLGGMLEYRVQIGEDEIVTRALAGTPHRFEVGAVVGVRWPWERGLVFPDQSGAPS